MLGYGLWLGGTPAQKGACFLSVRCFAGININCPHADVSEQRQDGDHLHHEGVHTCRKERHHITLLEDLA